MDFCERDGVGHITDISRYGRADTFIAALGPLPAIRVAKLLEALHWSNTRWGRLVAFPQAMFALVARLVPFFLAR